LPTSTLHSLKSKKPRRLGGNALIRISKDYETGDIEKATKTANAVLDEAYGYDIGPALFQPTLTVSLQTLAFKKEDDDKLKITLHDSSVPFKP